MGLKRSRPLMIDSHSTLTSINEEVKYSLSDEKDDFRDDDEDEFEAPPLKQKRASTSYDHDYVTTTPSPSSNNTPKSMPSSSRAPIFQFHSNEGTQNSQNGSKGVVINDITDSLNLLKSSLGVEYNNDKEPVIDFVVDSPISNNVQLKKN